MKSVLFVTGFSSRIRTYDLALEFERYGRLVRCDIPTPKSASSKPYAFVEYEDPRDAEDAFNEMHGRRVDGRTLNIQWAKNAPRASWRFERRPPTPRGGARTRSLSTPSRGRSRSPRPRYRSRSRSRSPARARGHHYERSRLPRSPSPRRLSR
ncbi:hypothetical protein BX666DRAFT_1998841 [Dichotomocladium elegans]|nr:hypothetical protein BX666DRAFT_1998841 [Dichotomocladium elegans]